MDARYRRLQQAERAFRHIKSYLKVRPIYHYKRERERSHVLIRFFAFYLVKRMELELRARGEAQEVEPLLRRWDQLRASEIWFALDDESHSQWQWSLGELGQEIRQEIVGVGWWKSLDSYLRSIMDKLAS